jgi:cell division protease FtsH
MFGKPNDEPFLGMDLHQRREYSEETARAIDKEVRRILTEAYRRAREILSTNLRALHAMADALLEREVLDSREIDEIIEAQGASIPPRPVPQAATGTNGGI